MENQPILEVTAMIAGRQILIIDASTGVIVNYVPNGTALVKFCNEQNCKLTNKATFTHDLQKLFKL